MKKTTVTILSLLSLFALGAPVGLQKTERVVNAASAATKCTAVAEGYAAVSNGKTLYVINEDNGGVWQEYAHTQPVKEMHFDGAGNLYFLDDTSLFRLNADSLDEETVAEDTGIDCYSFTVTANSLYYANVVPNQTSLYAAPLSDLTNAAAYTFYKSFVSFAHDGQTLYGLEWSSNSKSAVYALDFATQTARKRIDEFPYTADGATPQIALADQTVFTLTDGQLYGYDLNGSGATEFLGSFSALSAHQNQVYFLQGGIPHAYAVGESSIQEASGVFQKPHENAIPTGNLKTDVESGTAAFSIVETKAGALLVEIDFANSDATLKRVTSKRSEPLTALKIAQTAGYALLNYRESAESPYKTYLVDERSLTDKGGLTKWTEEKTGYLTNDVRLYKFPDMDLPSLQTATRGEQVALLGEIKGLDCTYYAVRYGEQTGYIPAGYVTLFNGEPPQSQTVTTGSKTTDKDAVWRLGYLVLGTGAICILADFLILRKKREE